MLDAGLVQAVDDVLTGRIYRNAVVGHQYVDTVARCGHGNHVLTYGCHAAAGQRGNDDAALGAGCRVRMSARCTAEHAVGAGDDVYVELGVDFKSRQHHIVQLVHIGTLVAGIGILTEVDLDVMGIREEMCSRALIEVLGIQNVIHQALVLQCTDGAGGTAEGKAHLDAGLLHMLLQETVHGQ